MNYNEAMKRLKGIKKRTIPNKVIDLSGSKDERVLFYKGSDFILVNSCEAESRLQNISMDLWKSVVIDVFSNLRLIGN